MSGHGHSHGCGHEHHEHDMSEAEKGIQFSLYLKVDTDNVECLNEVVDGSGKDVFKPWDKRQDTEKVLFSIIAHLVCQCFHFHLKLFVW